MTSQDRRAAEEIARWLNCERQFALARRPRAVLRWAGDGELGKAVSRTGDLYLDWVERRTAQLVAAGLDPEEAHAIAKNAAIDKETLEETLTRWVGDQVNKELVKLLFQKPTDDQKLEMVKSFKRKTPP